MNKKLSVIVTKTGDEGTTSLRQGLRVRKDNVFIKALGEVDELNSSIGVLLCENIKPEFYDALRNIQKELFIVCAELTNVEDPKIQEKEITNLESQIILWQREYPLETEGFIMLGGKSRAPALAHVCRTICRRVERTLISIDASTPINTHLKQYINRLSDWLFVLSIALDKTA